jgi:hypothetical protein
MTTATTQTLNVGDTVPVGTVLANLIIMGIVTDINNPNMFAATLQALQSQALLTVPVLQGIPGNPGQPSFALRFQNQVLASTDDLPTDLTNEPSDLGKYWVFDVTDQNANIIATQMQVWFGTSIGWQAFPIGTPGPVGPYPLITPNLVLVEPNNGQGPGGADSWMTVTGTVSNPTFTYYVAAPAGPTGPTATLDSCPDVDFATNAPSPGDSLVCSSRVTPGAPAALTITPSSTGGTFAAGSYFWEVTAIFANGDETLPSNEVTTTFEGSTSSVVLSWNAPGGGGAVGYKVYRGTSAFNISVLVTEIDSGATTTYTDTGSAGTPATPPSTGVTFGRSIWVPQSQSLMLPQLFTIPQSAFSSQEGIGGSTQSVCTFALPAQDWPWIPYVFGQMQIFGLNISLTPLLVGAEVLLGNSSNGQQIAAGEGNALGTVMLIPNPCNANNTSAAMTPTNQIGLVPANHTGTQGTIYINLVQQGMAGIFDFNANGSSASVLVVPCPS